MDTPNIDGKGMFSRKMLIHLIVPLLIEQLLTVTVGMADIMMVASVGETAVAGISLVDSINNLLINAFAALATGGVIVVAQLIGGEQLDKAASSAKQLLYLVTTFAVVLMTTVLFLNTHILVSIFGTIEPTVMDNAMIYFTISAVSYPFMAIFSSCAALMRAMGNSKVSMFVSFIMNIINITGNAILIYGFDMGVAGAGLATLLSRATAAAIMMFFISNKSNKIYIRKIHKIKFESNTIKTILRFGVPNGIENSMFQVGRLAVQGLISTFGTAAIAANAIAGSIIGFVQIPGGAISLSMVTVVGQCIGAGQDKWATYYVKKLLKISYLSMGALSIILFFSRSKIVSLFNLSPDAAKNAIDILAISAIFIMLFWSASFLLPSAFRAAGDNKFTMIISICSMWIFRIGFSYIVAQYFNMGLIGVWIAMFIDWIVRTIIYFSRFKSMKWIKERVT